MDWRRGDGRGRGSSRSYGSSSDNNGRNTYRGGGRNTSGFRSQGEASNPSGGSGPGSEHIGGTFSAEVVSVSSDRVLQLTVETTQGIVEGTIKSHFRFNRKESRPFAAGDKVSVLCLRMIDGRMELCPTSDYVLPLLILDVNGVLGAREAFERASKHRDFIVRQSAIPFIEAMRVHYEVALWTCSKRQTLLDDLAAMYPKQGGDREGDDFLFEWDQDDSTNLWPRTSVVAPQKPLFLKELARVWEEFPCYSSSNTVLLDNHTEKFERNPSYTCVIIPEYDGTGADDGSLAVDGELAGHLIAMAAGDTQTYISERAATVPFFQTDSPSIAAPASDTGADKDIVSLFYRLTRHEEEVQNMGHSSELPSTSSITLRRENLRRIVASPNYCVSDKAAGVECYLLATKEGGIYLLDLSLGVTEQPSDDATMRFLSSRVGGTVLFGDLVTDLRTAGGVFLVRDAIVVDGERVGLMTSFARRLSIAQKWIGSLSASGCALPFGITMKAQHPVWEMDGLMLKMKETAEDSCSWTFDDGSACHAVTGLVFTPLRASHYHCELLTWRPTHALTTDLSVAYRDLVRDAATVPGSCLVGQSTAALFEVALERSASWHITAIAQRGKSSASLVLECCFDHVSGVWRAVKESRGKGQPSSAQSVFATLEAIAENLSISQLTEELSHIPSASRVVAEEGDDSTDPAGSLSSYTSEKLGRRDQSIGYKGNCSERSKQGDARARLSASVLKPSTEIADRDAPVESHYDKIQRARRDGGKEGLDASIAALRKFQNWNKACMIKTLMQPASVQTVEQLLEGLNVDYDITAVDVLQTPCGKPRGRRASSVPLKILDLACGRGGDLNKWTKDSAISLYVGVDISIEELREASVRSAGLDKGRSVYFFHKSSCDSPSLLSELYNALGSSANLTLEPRAHKEKVLCGFNVVWCQFALHYFCESRDSLMGYLRNVSTALSRGGRFCASFPNTFHIISHMNHIAQSGDKKSGSDVCYITSDSTQSKSIEEALLEFGIVYKFTLGDAVQECSEFVVPLRALISMAEEVGLRLVQLQSMHAFMAKCAQDEELASLREVMQLVGGKSAGRRLSSDEWDAIGLYCLVVFEKV